MKNNRQIMKDRQAIRELAYRYWNRNAPGEERIPDVVGIEDMVRISGFTKGSLYVFSTRDDFPAPVARRANKRLLWRRADFDGWLKAKKTARRGGRTGREPGAS